MPKKTYDQSGKASISKDMITSVNFNQSFGTVITYYNGNLKLVDPHNFSIVWTHDERSLNHDDEKLKKTTQIGVIKKLETYNYENAPKLRDYEKFEKEQMIEEVGENLDDRSEIIYTFVTS